MGTYGFYELISLSYPFVNKIYLLLITLATYLDAYELLNIRKLINQPHSDHL